MPCCGCVDNIISTIKNAFTSGSKQADKKTGLLAGRTAAEIEADSKETVAQTAEKTSEAVIAAIQDIVEGIKPDLTKLSDKERQQVAEGVRRVRLADLAWQVAISPEATDLTTAEKVAAKVLNTYLDLFIDNMEKQKQPPEKIPEKDREEVKQFLAQAVFGTTPKDIAIAGMTVREKMKEEFEKMKELQKQKADQSKAAPATAKA
jgi:hypothetical protein